MDRLDRGACTFLIPGDWNTPTGGFTYDRRMVLGLRAAGWQVNVQALPGTWPHPDTQDRAAAESLVAALPSGTLVVADGLAFGPLGALVAQHARRLRWVALVHHPLHLETGLSRTQSERLRTDEAQALGHALRVVVTSSSTARDVQALGVAPQLISVVEPGTDRVPQMHREKPGAAVRLLCVATLTERKGHAVLLQALSGLTHLDWTLHNVGSAERDPATAARLHAMAEPLGDRVVWHGELGADQVQAQYAAADVFVLASLHEGYGMVVAEAVAHGLPVIASDAGALAHTLPPGAGLQVKAGDAAALRGALNQVLESAELRERLALGARTAACGLPDWTQQAVRLATELERVP